MKYPSMFFAVIALALSLSGCGDSDFGVANFMLPVFPEGAEVNPDPFTGTWHGIEDNAMLKIEKVKNSSVYVHFISASDTLRFTGTAFGIDGEVYLDLMPDIPEDAMEKLGYLVIYLFPTHTVARIRLRDTTMDFSLMDPFKLSDFIARSADVLPHVKPDAGSIAITATRQENYNFLKTHARSVEGLFDDAIALVRKEQ